MGKKKSAKAKLNNDSKTKSENSIELTREAKRLRNVARLKNLLKCFADPPTLVARKPEKIEKLPHLKKSITALEKLGFEYQSCFLAYAINLRIAAYNEFGSGGSSDMLTKHLSAAFRVGLTDKARGFDALLCTEGWSNEEPYRIEIFAHATDGPALSVCNQEVPCPKEMPLRVLNRNVFIGNNEKQLVQELEKLVGKGSFTNAPTTDSFEDRYVQLQKNAINDLRTYVAEIISQQPCRRSDDSLSRFERMGIYHELWDDEENKNETTHDVAIRESAFTNFEPDERHFSLEMTIRDAACLLILNHHQYQGAIPVDHYLNIACQRVGLLFESFENSPHEFEKSRASTGTLLGWAMLLLADQSDVFRETCQTIKAGMAKSSNWSYEEPDEAFVAQVLLLIASKYRPKPVYGAKSLPKKIRGSDSRQAQLLLDLWEAVESQDQEAFDVCLPVCLQHSREMLREKDSQLPYYRAAWAESLIVLLAKQEGMSIPELPLELEDWLITKQSIR